MTKKKILDPKGIPGAKKVQLHLVPPSAIQATARAFEQGAVKYGPFNWRESGQVNVSTYVSAALRHIQAFQDGENMVPDNANAHHLGAAMASLAVIIDSQVAGTLKDDRPKSLLRPVYGVSPGTEAMKNIKEYNKFLQDQLLYGTSIIRIKPSDMFSKKVTKSKAKRKR